MVTNVSPPVTYSMAFVKAGPSSCVEAFVRFRKEKQLVGMKHKVEVLSSPGIKDSIMLLHPLNTPYSKVLFGKTTSEWTAVFFNDKNGSGCAEHISRLSVQLRTISLDISCTPHTLTPSEKSGFYGCTSFSLYGPDDGPYLNLIRSVSVSYQNSWEFHQWGEPQPFEDPSAYERHKKKDRLTPSMIGLYMEYFGIDIFNSDFYFPPGSQIYLAF